MAHEILHGNKHGAVHGLKHGALTLGGGAPPDPLASVAKDGTSNKYVPATLAQWNTVLSVAGVPTSGPTCLWLAQEASGNLADTIGGVTLTQTGTGHLYQQAVTGWSRTACKTIEGTVGQRWLNSTTAPNPATTSVLWFGYYRFPVSAPAAARDIVANQANLDCRLAATTGRISILNGASTTGAIAHIGGDVHPFLMKHDITNSTFMGYTDLEKITGVFAVNASNPMISFGGQTIAAGDIGYLYLCEFSGANAELTDAQVKLILQTLGWTIPWT